MSLFDKAIALFIYFTYVLAKGIGRKISREEQRNKQDRKIAPLSLSLLYQYHVWKSKGLRPPSADAHGPSLGIS